MQTAGAVLPYVGPLSLPAALAVGAAARQGKRFGGGVCTVALAALFAGWAFRTHSLPAASSSSETIRVITLNVAEGRNGREGPIADYVETLDADLVLLQEAGISWGPYAPVAGRIRALGGYELYTDTTSGPEGAGRQVMLSKWPVLSYESGYLAAREDKSGVYSRAVVDWNGTQVAVYNVHLRAFNPDVGWSRERMTSPEVWGETPDNLRAFYAEQAVEAESLLRRVEAEERPVLVGGDFNAAPDQWSRALLGRSLRETTGRWLPSATRPAGISLVNVDGVLASTEWALAEASVGPSGFSDHRAVTAALSLKP